MIMPAPAQESPAPVAPPEVASVSLYDLEAKLEALEDSIETVTPEQESEFLAEFGKALVAAKEKRDRVQAYMVRLEASAAAADVEMKRQQARKVRYERALEGLESYVASIIVGQGKDAKDKWRKMEGENVTFSLRACPATVVITDEMAIPARHKTITISLPAETWETLLDSLEMELRAQVLDQVKRPDVSVSKTSVKDEIERETPDVKKQLEAEGARVRLEALPGAVLVPGRMKLVRK